MIRCFYIRIESERQFPILPSSLLSQLTGPVVIFTHPLLTLLGDQSLLFLPARDLESHNILLLT